jgi:hypothetical protein
MLDAFFNNYGTISAFDSIPILVDLKYEHRRANYFLQL